MLLLGVVKILNCKGKTSQRAVTAGGANGGSLLLGGFGLSKALQMS